MNTLNFKEKISHTNLIQLPDEYKKKRKKTFYETNKLKNFDRDYSKMIKHNDAIQKFIADITQKVNTILTTICIRRTADFRMSICRRWIWIFVLLLFLVCSDNEINKEVFYDLIKKQFIIISNLTANQWNQKISFEKFSIYMKNKIANWNKMFKKNFRWYQNQKAGMKSSSWTKVKKTLFEYLLKIKNIKFNC